MMNPKKWAPRAVETLKDLFPTCLLWPALVVLLATSQAVACQLHEIWRTGGGPEIRFAPASGTASGGVVGLEVITDGSAERYAGAAVKLPAESIEPVRMKMDGERLDYVISGGFILDADLVLRVGEKEVVYSGLSVRYSNGDIPRFLLVDENGGVWFQVEGFETTINHDSDKLTFTNGKFRPGGMALRNYPELEGVDAPLGRFDVQLAIDHRPLASIDAALSE